MSRPLPVGELCADCAAACLASCGIAPVVAALDRAVTENAAGTRTILASLRRSVAGALRDPARYCRGAPTAWLFAVYASTYASVNCTRTLCGWVEASPAAPVLAASTVASASTCVAKDRAFARLFGAGAPRAVPPLALGLWLGRDLVSMACIFTLPPLLSPRAAGGDVDVRAQLAAPVAAQLATTPLHLVGLNVYNNTRGGAARGHAAFLRAEYLRSLAARVARVLPAFSFGAVANARLRERLAAAAP